MKDKNFTAFYAILLGTLGVHKFYLGKNFQGLLYIIGLFIAISYTLTIIPIIITVIEGIYFIALSKEDFDLKYNFEYMQKQDYIKNRKS